jgi:hypothetical protein
MKRWLWACGTISVVAVLSIAGLVWREAGVSEKAQQGAVTRTAPKKYKPVRGVQMDTAQVAVSVDELLRDGSHRAWEKLTALYKGADDPTKRKILRHATELPELKRALAYVLASVGDDLTPVQEDPMIEEAAELLKRRWAEPEDLDLGREMMLIQKSDKRQWVMAKAMISFAKTVPSDGPFRAQKKRLSAKLIDFHSTTSSPFIRAEIVSEMPGLGSGDVALVLAQGPNVNLDQLEAVKTEKAAQAAAIEALNRGSK